MRFQARRAQSNPTLKALELAGAWLGGGGLTLAAGRLSEEEAEDLRQLVNRWSELSDAERLRVENLVGTAAGDPDVFQDRRTRAQAKTLAREARRLPQSGDIIAAVLSDESVRDDLVFQHRDSAIEISDFGMPQAGGAGRVLEIEDIGTLAVVLHAIGANGGRPVRIGESGALGDGLPNVEIARVGHLRVNGLLTNRRDGSSWLAGYGPRISEIAVRWKIEVPVEEADSQTTVAS